MDGDILLAEPRRSYSGPWGGFCKRRRCWVGDEEFNLTKPINYVSPRVKLSQHCLVVVLIRNPKINIK